MTDNTHGQVPAIQRFEVVDCIDDKHVPAVIPKPHGPWVRYEDHIAALAAGQATAAQQGVAYAALPEYGINTASHAHFRVLGFTADQMRAFADATCALRASHGQAPADAKALAEADRRAGEAERILATCKENVMRFEQVRSRMKYQWGADQRVSFDEVWDEALALKKAAQAAPQAADSVTAPAPPPECETEAEKRAFAFGWFKALESERMKADSVQEDAARESEYRRGYRHGYEQRDAEVRGAMA